MSTGTRPQARWAAPAVILAIALAAFWPALVNGGPFYMADTPSYVRAAASGFFKLLHVQTEWAQEYLRVYAGPGGAPAAASAPSADSPATAGQIPVTLSGRSIFYGAFVYLAHLAGSLWFVVAVQSLLAGASIYLTVEAIARAAGKQVRPRDALLVGLIAVAATPLGYFTGFLMPDLFGGFALLATANLIFLWQGQSRGRRAFWLLLLAYSLLAHGVNVMMVAALTVVALLYAWWRRVEVSPAAVAGIVGCILVAMAGQALFAEGVKAMTGAPPVRPPFLAMRLIADGPGRTYLEKHCPKANLIYCRTAGRRSVPSDALLWTKDPNVSLFRGLTPNEQRRSAAEQSKFVRAVFAERPLEVAGIAARNSLDQLVDLRLAAFNYSAENRSRFEDTIPPNLLERMKGTRAWNNLMPTTAVEAGTALLAALSLVLLVGWAAYDRGRGRAQLRGFCLAIVAGFLINAALCGALSGPKGRYEMRLIWVLPVVALALASAAFQRRGMKPAEMPATAA